MDHCESEIIFLAGNVKDIIAQSTRQQDDYMDHFDALAQYMYSMKVPKYTVLRVKDWCQYTWATQKSFDEVALLETLPKKERKSDLSSEQ